MLVDGLCASLPAALLGSLALCAMFVACLYLCTAHQPRSGRGVPEPVARHPRSTRS